MKKLFLLLLTMAILPVSYVCAEDDEEVPPPPPPTEEPKPLPFNPLPIPPSTLEPRSLSPISGVYVDGVVELYFAADVGSVSVTVSSSTTGNMWSEESESCDGLILVNIGRAPGSYVVNIDTETAGSFVGQFTI